MSWQRVAADGTVKLFFPAGGGRTFEAAFFHIPGRDLPYIACVSTQLGCAVGCGFCATTPDGFVRQLTAAEIASQIASIARLAIARGASESEIEVSFMGMGEPLANRRGLVDAIHMTHQAVAGIRRVAVSTVGPARRIIEFVTDAEQSPIPVHLQISLHATRDDVRLGLIPRAGGTIDGLIDAGREYSIRTGDRVCLNYVLLDGVNDADGDADWLSRVDRARFYVKLTHLNSVESLPRHLRSSPPERFRLFRQTLADAGVAHKEFTGDGLDVHASCGQLAARPIALYRSPALLRTA